MAVKLNFQWVGDFHSLGPWTELLIRTRKKHPPLAYKEPRFASLVEDKARRISAIWRVDMRYHTNRPYPYEVAGVEDAVKWLLDPSSKL